MGGLSPNSQNQKLATRKRFIFLVKLNNVEKPRLSLCSLWLELRFLG